MVNSTSFHKSNIIDNIKNDNTKQKGKEKNRKKNIIVYNDTELNIAEYVVALKIDKRTYLQYYWSLIKKNKY